MLTRSRVVAVLAALVVVPPACAVGDAPDADDEATDDADDEATEETLDPIIPGPCATACLEVANDRCNWRDDCDRWPEEGITCGPRALTCRAAEEASAATAYGVSYCWRSCEGLR